VKIRFSPRARDDRRSAVEYLTGRNPGAAAELRDQLLLTIQRLADGEFQGPEVQLRSGAIVRSWPVVPYRIYYQRSTDLLRIVRVYHQAREPIAAKQKHRTP
jgi:plasmid stabilization system protein ParE